MVGTKVGGAAGKRMARSRFRRHPARAQLGVDLFLPTISASFITRAVRDRIGNVPGHGRRVAAGHEPFAWAADDEVVHARRGSAGHAIAPRISSAARVLP